MQLENYNRKSLAIATIAHWEDQVMKRSSESPLEQPSWVTHGRAVQLLIYTLISVQISASRRAIPISSSYSSTGISASATSSASQGVLNSRCPPMEHPCCCSLVHLHKWFALWFQNAFEMCFLALLFHQLSDGNKSNRKHLVSLFSISLCKVSLASASRLQEYKQPQTLSSG